VKHEIAVPVVLLLHCPAGKWSHWVQYLSGLWCLYYTVRQVNEIIEYNVCHVCDALLHWPVYLRSHWVQCLSHLRCLYYDVCHVCDGSLLRMSVTSVMPLLRCLSCLWCLYYDVCHVCDAFTTMSVTAAGGGDGWWMQISALKLQHFLSVRVSQKM
jgi:hypothetical protein